MLLSMQLLSNFSQTIFYGDFGKTILLTKSKKILILYDGTTSVCQIKVRLTLVEKGLPFESRNLDLRKGDHFSKTHLKINPTLNS